MTFHVHFYYLRICAVCLRVRGLRSQICDLFVSYWLLLDAKVALPATAGYG